MKMALNLGTEWRDTELKAIGDEWSDRCVKDKALFVPIGKALILPESQQCEAR
jgi:hypothetical protein